MKEYLRNKLHDVPHNSLRLQPVPKTLLVRNESQRVGHCSACSEVLYYSNNNNITDNEKDHKFFDKILNALLH